MTAVDLPLNLTFVTSDGTTKQLTVDLEVDVPHLKELCVREGIAQPSFSRFYFNDVLLKGSGLVTDFGVVDGSTITIK
jgi:hypothetical protein